MNIAALGKQRQLLTCAYLFCITTACTNEYTAHTAEEASTTPAGLSTAYSQLRAGEDGTKPVVVSLTFDDQRISQRVVPNLLSANDRNFKATFFVISGGVNNAPGDDPDLHPRSLSVDELLAFEHEGHEIGGHSRHHENLTQLDGQAQIEEICGGRDDLHSFGLGAWQPITSFAYPYGSYDDSVKAVAASCGFTSARTVATGPESLPAEDAFALRTNMQGGSITKDDSVESIEWWVKSAEPGEWVQLVWHDIASSEYTPEDQYSQTVEDFSAVLDFLKNEQDLGHISVKTVGDAVRESSWQALRP